jgi:hypothetical protein
VSTVWDDAFERPVTSLQRRAALLALVRVCFPCAGTLLRATVPCLSGCPGCGVRTAYVPPSSPPPCLIFPCHALSCPGPYGPNTQAHAASTKRGYVYMLSLFPGFPLRMDELARTCEDLSIRGCVLLAHQ